jgi:hypothetical protein
MNEERRVGVSPVIYNHIQQAPVYTTRHTQTHHTALLIVNGKINNVSVLLQHKYIELAMLRPLFNYVKTIMIQD